MSMDRGWTGGALANDASSAPDGMRPGTDRPGRWGLVVVVAAQLMWVAALAYGLHRAFELV